MLFKGGIKNQYHNIRIANLITLTTGQIIQPRAATSKNFFFPWFVLRTIINADITLLNPFGEQAKWIPANSHAFSGTLQTAFYNARCSVS